VNVDLWKSRFKEYLQLRNYSPRSIEAYVSELKSFLAHLEVIGVDSLAALTRDHVEDYRAFLAEATYRGQRLAVSTQAHRLANVKVFTRFLARERFISIDPGASVDRPRVPRTAPGAVLSELEAERVVESTAGVGPVSVRNRAMLEVLYCTGIRNQELRELRLHDVHLERAELHVRCGKGGKARMLPLGEDAIAWLKEYLLRARPYLVASGAQRVLFLSYRGHPLSRTAVAKIVRGLAVQSGLKKMVTPHVLRRSCATHMLRHGAGLRQVQEMLGHASPQTTEKYTRMEVSDLRRALQRFHPREKKG